MSEYTYDIDKYTIGVADHKYASKCEDKVITIENQQKEFINYINSYIELLKDKPDLVEEGQKDILEEILSKYKEITGQQGGQVDNQVGSQV